MWKPLTTTVTLFLTVAVIDESCSFSLLPTTSKVFHRSNHGSLFETKKDYKDGEIGDGPNWIEKSFPVETSEKIDTKKVEDYNLGIAGEAFQTGPLSKKMFDAIIARTSLEMSDEIREAFTLCAMDFTAKEAARAALTQNGLDMTLKEDEEDQGMWGDVDSVRLYDTATGVALSTIYDTLEDAVQEWEPGQPFDFVARQVPAKMRELSMDELVQALDPDGSMREEAKETRGEDIQPDEDALSAIFDDEEVTSLEALANQHVMRRAMSPQEATIEGEEFAGGKTKGYNVIAMSDLLKAARDDDGAEKEKTLMHVMNALVSHGVLLVDVTDGGKNFGPATELSNMWDTTTTFFAKVDADVDASLGGMKTPPGTDSKDARVGFELYGNGSLAFLETRRERGSGKFLPEDAGNILGSEGIEHLGKAFDVMAQIGKDVVRIATAASSVEYGTFTGNAIKSDKDLEIQASKAASLMADELIDDAKALNTKEVDSSKEPISMSPLRLNRYLNQSEKSEGEEASAVLGALIDPSFVTAVPVAGMRSLEVFDEEGEKWYLPELKARAHWEAEQTAQNKDAKLSVDVTADGKELPWHARYVAIIAGEYLQLCTRDEVPASVHRATTVNGSAPRYSASVLLKGRPGVKFNVKRYLGATLGNSLLGDCDGKTIEQIQEAMQPTPFE